MEPQNNTTEKIIAAIEQQKVTPRPKWYFVARNTVLWIPGVITTLLGAYTIAGVLYGVLHAHFFENTHYMQYSSPVVFIAVIPLLWVISFGVFLVITVSLLRKTNTGYRHTAVQLLLISVASSILIGVLFYTVTAGSINDNVTTYYRHPTQNQEEHAWNDPDDGRISGIITHVDGTSISLRTFNGITWTVSTASLPPMIDPLPLHEGNAIRIVGVTTSDHVFMACRVLPWELFPAQPSHITTMTIPANPSTCDQVLAHFQQ